MNAELGTQDPGTAEPDAVEAVPDYRALSRLDGKVAVVIGAGQGMGRQSAHAARSAGATVVAVDQDAGRAAAVAAELGTEPLTADVTRREDVAAVFAAVVEQYGRVDTVIDVVGMAAWHSVIDTPETIWQRAFDLCTRQALFVLQEAAPRMTDGGAFGFVSSVSGIRGAQEHSAYGAAKAALISLVCSAAVELAPRGIRVNSVAPGVIATTRTRHTIFADPEVVARQSRIVPLGRLGEASEIASVLAFLVSDAAAYVTGQTLVVDGGVTAKFPLQTSR